MWFIFVKKYKAYPLWFFCENNTRLTPCDLFVGKIQGLPLVILFVKIKIKAYPLWFICKKKIQCLPLVIFLGKEFKVYPMGFIFV